MGKDMVDDGEEMSVIGEDDGGEEANMSYDIYAYKPTSRSRRIGIIQASMIDTKNGIWNLEGESYMQGSGKWRPEAVEYNLREMKDVGLDHVRIHFSAKYYRIYMDYCQNLKAICDIAKSLGMSVILELFMVQSYEDGVGADALPYPPYSKLGSEEYIFDEDDFVLFWGEVADDFKDVTNVCFEIYNEPNGKGTENGAWLTVAQRCIDKMRDMGFNGEVLVMNNLSLWYNLSYPPQPSENYGMQWVTQYPLSDSVDNLTYTFHLYGEGGIHKLVDGKRVECYTYEDIKEGLRLCGVDDLVANGVRVMCTEFGANMYLGGVALEHQLEWYDSVCRRFTELGIDYTSMVWTITAHIQWAIFNNELWLPSLNREGELLKKYSSYREVNVLTKLKINGVVSHQMAEGEEVTIIISRVVTVSGVGEDSSVTVLTALTNADGSFNTIEELTVAGLYRFVASIEADSGYEGAESNVVEYTVNLASRMITLNVTVA